MAPKSHLSQSSLGARKSRPSMNLGSKRVLKFRRTANERRRYQFQMRRRALVDESFSILDEDPGTEHPSSSAQVEIRRGSLHSRRPSSSEHRLADSSRSSSSGRRSFVAAASNSKQDLEVREATLTTTVSLQASLSNLVKSVPSTNSGSSPRSKVGQKMSRVLECSICRDVMTEPVSLPRCGHSFCRECINQWLKRNKPSKKKPNPNDSSQCCPLCKHKVWKNDELSVNCTLRELSEIFRTSEGESIEHLDLQI